MVGQIFSLDLPSLSAAVGFDCPRGIRVLEGSGVRAGNVNIGNSRLLGQKSDFSDQPGKYFSLLPQNLSALRADEHLGQKN